MSTQSVFPILEGEEPDPDNVYARFKPVRYTYVMAYLHDEDQEIRSSSGSIISVVPRKAGEVMYILPMTTTSYRNTMYSGTEFNGSIYLPDFYLDLMVHPPSNDYERRRHPNQEGSPIGSLFECGNRAIYVLRNDEVVWGGILWSRNYSSGSPTMEISAVSFDAYAYYRLLRRSVVFKQTPKVNTYTIWYAVMKGMLTDFSWTGANNGMVANTLGEAQSITKYTSGPKKGQIKGTVSIPWTGITRGVMNAPDRDYYERWPNNSPKIELPPEGLKLYSPDNTVEYVEDKEFRGYDMNMVGQQLEEWADTKTVVSLDGGKRFEYRVVYWFDSTNQVFKQRYVVGNMGYASNSSSNAPIPNKILSPYLGTNTKEMAKGPNNALIFDFPGHISSWSLSESNEGCATRVVVTDGNDAAAKHVEYASQSDLLNKPASNGSKGWLLYDHVTSYDLTDSLSNYLSKLRSRVGTVLSLLHVGVAAQVNDLASANGATQRSSERSTSFSVTLYTTPDRPLPKFEVGDWATFAIEDPFYGGKMYLVRRIMGYSVTVVPEQENTYSHETVELDLTDDTQIDMGT